MTEVTPQSDFFVNGRKDLATKVPQTTDPWLRALMMGLSRISVGSLALTLPTGEPLVFGFPASEGPNAVIELHRTRAAKRILKSGDIGLGESYMDGDWSSPDVRAVIELALVNEDSLKSAIFGKWVSGIAHFIHHILSRNTKNGSRRNIAYHYDLGNEFYRRWLDETMTYSAALFQYPEQFLGAAQRHKYRRIAELAGVSPGAKVLEIGCGWGGFAELAATEYGASVDGITLSAEQLAYARQRMEKLDLKDQVKLHMRDYRDQRGVYDAIVSIEMFEAVGEENWDSYFQALKRNLKHNGKAVVQVITIDEARFDTYRKTADFIQRYIFPGGLLPSKTAFIAAARRNGLQVAIREEFGADYAETLRRWKEKFHASWREVEALGFDQRFKRMWEFYLQYCEAGFRQKSIDVVIFELR